MSSSETTAPAGEIADRLAIRRLVDEYARRVDRVDAAGAAALFTEDGTLRIFGRGETEPNRERRGRDEMARAFAGLTRYDVTMHLVGNHLVELDGDRAAGETYCQASHISSEERPDGTIQREVYVMHIRYEDRFVRTDAGWLIDRRELRVEFTETRPVD